MCCVCICVQLNADLKSVDEDKDRAFAKLNDEIKAKEDLQGDSTVHWCLFFTKVIIKMSDTEQTRQTKPRVTINNVSSLCHI